MKKRYLTLILITLCIISLLLGAKSINIADILTGHDESMHLMLVSRIPRLISTLVAGSAMSICGLIMQQISQNKFVSPTTGATIDSAKLGIVIAMVLVPGATTMQKAMISFVFALAGTMLFMTFLKNLKVNINLELERYKNRENISIDEFKEVLKYISNKKNASFFREVEFKIYSSLKREFEIIDSIGLNHGEGIKKDVGLLREARLLNIISKYPSHKIIYILNCMTTTSATLKPIEFIEKMGALSKTIMVVTQLDRENITFDEFI